MAAAEERIIQLQKVIEGYAADIARKAAKAAHEAGEQRHALRRHSVARWPSLLCASFRCLSDHRACGTAVDWHQHMLAFACHTEGTKEVSAYNKRIAELGKIVAQHVTEYNSLVPSGSRLSRQMSAGDA